MILTAISALVDLVEYGEQAKYDLVNLVNNACKYVT